MSTSLTAFIESLARAGGLWNTQASELYSVAASLDDVDPNLLGRNVAPVAERFFAHWAERCAALHDDAEGNGTAIREFVTHLQFTDRDAVERLHGLVPYGFEFDVDEPL